MTRPIFKSVLVLAPHTDDAELGCGGTIARFVGEGVAMHIAVFSTAEQSLPQGFPPSALKDEFIESIQRLGLSGTNCSIFDYPVRLLSYHRQEVLDRILDLRKTLSPDLVLIPSGNDLHQDHQVVYAEGLRAFKEHSVWGYELPWNTVSFTANAFVKFGSAEMDRKWDALQCYKTQLALKKSYFTKEFVWSLATVRGVQVKSPFAEAYEVIRIQI